MFMKIVYRFFGCKTQQTSGVPAALPLKNLEVIVLFALSFSNFVFIPPSPEEP